MLGDVQPLEQLTGQHGVYEFLQRLRDSGDDDYYSMAGLKKRMRDAGYDMENCKMRRALMRLAYYGILDYDEAWPRKFRFRRVKIN